MVIGFKAFNKGLVCRGFKYRVGKLYGDIVGKLKLCSNGYHFCQNPLNVFKYYDINTSEYARVEAVGDIIAPGKNEEKSATNKLIVKNKLTLPQLMLEAAAYIKSRAAHMCGLNRTFSTILNNAYVSDSRYGCTFASAGTETNMLGGLGCQYAAAGRNSNVISLGGSANIAVLGDGSFAYNSGKNSKITATGNSSNIVTAGYRDKVSVLGGRNNIISTGKYAIITSIGASNSITAKGPNSTVIAIGHRDKAKAARGCWLVLAEWTFNNSGEYTLKCIKTTKVDGINIKPNTWYTLINEKFVEVASNG